MPLGAAYVLGNVIRWGLRSSNSLGYGGVLFGKALAKSSRKIAQQFKMNTMAEFFDEGGAGFSALVGNRRTIAESRMAYQSLDKSKGPVVKAWRTKHEDMAGYVQDAYNKGPGMDYKSARGILGASDDVWKQTGKRFPDSLDALQGVARDRVTIHKKRMLKSIGVTAATAYLATAVTRKAFDVSAAITSNSLNFVSSIAEFEAIRNIPMMNTSQALTERRAALRFIQEYRTKSSYLLGKERGLRLV